MANLKMPKTDEELKGMKIANLRSTYLTLAKDFNDIVDNKITYCPKCGKWLSSTNFYQNKNNADNLEHWGCKKCIILACTDYDKKTDTYTDNKEKTKYVLQRLDLPFIEKTYDDQVQAAIDGLGEKNRSTGVQTYLTMLASLPQYRTMDWSSSEFLDGEDAIVNNSNRKPRKETYKIFGNGFSTEDMLYLQDQYDDWRSRTQVDSKSQETYIVQICFKQLEIWKAQKSGKDTDKLVKSLNDLMNGANLQPRQNVSNAATDALTFGQLIEKWENEKPIPEPDEEFKDCLGIDKKIRVWFKGHLARCMGLDNGYSQEYDEYISQYTVKKQEVADEESSEGIYNKLFGKAGE